MLDPPLAPMQFVVATLAGIGRTNEEIADLLGLTIDTIKTHILVAGRKIPGDLPPRLKVVAWARGATLEVLTGSQLKGEVMDQARQSHLGPLFPHLTESVGSAR